MCCIDDKGRRDGQVSCVVDERWSGDVVDVRLRTAQVVVAIRSLSDVGMTEVLVVVMQRTEWLNGVPRQLHQAVYVTVVAC